MSNAIAVVYKPHDHGEDYMVFVDDQKEYEQWKEDKSIALARFLGQFSIYRTDRGMTGQLGEVSRQEIETHFFGDNKEIKDKSVEAAIQIILQQGHIHKGDLSHTFKLTKNPAQGAGDVRGTGQARGTHR